MLFKDVTSEAGIDHVGITFGSSWGDFNGDRLPDLWLGNHGHDADLYLNQGDGTFVDISSEVFTDLGSRDRHGAAWGDFDNDGDQDLIQLIGGKVGTGNLSDPNFANQLFINEGGTLVNEAELYGVDYASSRAKTPVWLDVNRDGLLDLFVGAASRRDGLVPTTIFQQKNGELGFTNLADNSNFKLLPGTYGFLSDLVPSRDGLELAVIDNANDGLEIYDSRTIANISDEVIDSNLRGKDFVSADFNGDLLPDLYITRQGLNNSGFARDSNGKIRLRLESTSDVTKGIRFKVDGDLSLDFYTFGFAHDRIEADDIYIGASGFNPDDLTFSLAADNPEVAGIQSFREGIDEGVYIGHTPDSQTWEIILSSANQDLLLGFLDSTAAISDLTAIDFDNNRPPQQDSLLINDNGQLKDFSVESGINSVRNAGLSAVAGDFDN
ncbi:MAG: VCBS repeat-containing protein, partial [Cyanobacteria bacterium J06558_2]